MDIMKRCICRSWLLKSLLVMSGSRSRTRHPVTPTKAKLTSYGQHTVTVNSQVLGQDWCNALIEATGWAKNADQGLVPIVNNLDDVDIVITESYDGTLAAGFAAHKVFQSIKEHKCFCGDTKSTGKLNLNGKVIHWSATDNNTRVRDLWSTIKNKENGFTNFKPVHFFGDMTDRVPEDVLAHCKAIEADLLGQAHEAFKKHKSGLLSKAEFHTQQDELGATLFGELDVILKHTKFNDKVWCYRTNQFVWFSPRQALAELSNSSSSSPKKWLWIECCGNTCCPWSPRIDHST